MLGWQSFFALRGLLLPRELEYLTPFQLATGLTPEGYKLPSCFGNEMLAVVGCDFYKQMCQHSFLHHDFLSLVLKYTLPLFSWIFTYLIRFLLKMSSIRAP